MILFLKVNQLGNFFVGPASAVVRSFASEPSRTKRLTSHLSLNKHFVFPFLRALCMILHSGQFCRPRLLGFCNIGRSNLTQLGTSFEPQRMEGLARHFRFSIQTNSLSILTRRPCRQDGPKRSNAPPADKKGEELRRIGDATTHNRNGRQVRMI